MSSQLGELTVGSGGSQQFGDFDVTWRVFIDHVEWRLTERDGVDRGALTGALKYVGWNRISVEERPQAATEKEPLSELAEHLHKMLSEIPASPPTVKPEGLRKAPPSFEVYVHQWPDVRRALDFVYYTLGRMAPAGTGYESSFVPPEE